MANGIASLNPFAQGVLPGQDTLVGFTEPRARQMEELIAAQIAAQQPQSVQQPTAAQSLMPSVPTLEEEFRQRQETYRGILGDPAEQRNLTQAQILFDLANTALAFSTAGSRPGMSPAERLAEAAVETQLFPKIGARTQAVQDQQQKFDLAALQSAETSLAAKQKAASDYQEALLKQKPDLYMVTLPGEEPRPVNGATQFGKNVLAYAQTVDGAKVEELSKFGSEGSKITTETRLTTENVVIGGVEVPKGTPVELTDAEAQALPPGSVIPYSKEATGSTKSFTAREDIIIGDRVVPKGTQFQATPQQVLQLDPKTFVEYEKPDTKSTDTKQYVPTREIVVGNQTIAEGIPVLLTDDQVAAIGDPTALRNFDNPAKQNNYTPNKTFEFNGREYGPGDELALTPTQVNAIQKTYGLDALQQWDPKEGAVQDNYLLSEPFVLKDGTELAANQVVSLTRLQANELPKNTSRKLSGSPSMENWFDPKSNRTLNLKNIGGTLFDMNQGGVKVDFSLPEYAGIVEVPENVQLSEFKLQQSQARSAEEARELEQELLGQNAAQLVTSTPAQNLPGNRAYNQADQRLVYDAVEAARISTGPYGQLKRSFNAIVGGLSPVDTEFFSNSVRANNLIRSINVLGRVAVANSPRFAEGEQVRLAPLFPDPDAFFTNPQTQIKKLVDLKRYVEGEKLINLENLATESDPTIRRQMKQQNYAIDSLLRLLEGVPRMGVLSAEEESALDALRANQ